MMSRHIWLLPAAVLCVAAFGNPAFAAARIDVEAPRADGHMTPLAVYEAAPGGASCAPLAVISPGAGGTRDGYRYLAEIMTELEFRVIVMGHVESGPSALRADIRAGGFRPGLATLVGDPGAEQARLMDIGAALDWASAHCRSDFRVLLGHSMGSETVMMEAGARNEIGVPAPPALQDRFAAYVALSPEGPGLVFGENAWSNVKKPMLLLTGTGDRSLTGPPLTRQIPWRELSGIASHCQWLGVIAGASHMNFAGVGVEAARVDAQVKSMIGAFLAGVHAGACRYPAVERDVTLYAK
jgi:predicted dienelactone hydrolase